MKSVELSKRRQPPKRLFVAEIEVVRCGQRYQNFDRAFQQLAKALDGRPFSAYSELELAGLEKCFELAYELPMPYRFDVVPYETIENPELREHIDRVGVVLI